MLSMAGYEELEGMGKIGLEAVATGMIEVFNYRLP